MQEAFVCKCEVSLVKRDTAEQNDQGTQPEHIRQRDQMGGFFMSPQKENDKNGGEKQRAASNPKPKHKAKRLTSFGERIFSLPGCVLRTHLPIIDIFEKRNSR
ncbi:hypothetical protein GCM10007423_59390 [Dyadobacter endophyticus]|uniref:Uncharacterized protein n=1 Tax=Dyadobacter endophyticus TaxID=1749036 RepID=A0ABQ1Z8C2_9BACT|nr:hypothetical protein GCM10007423_59390 [Dyadobacter endophyticus]